MRPGWTKSKPWKAQDEGYLRRFYTRLPLDRLAEHLRRTPCSVKSRASKLHLDKGTKHRWTPAEDELLRKLYPNTITKEIAASLRLAIYFVYNRAWNLGLEKSAEFMASLDAIEAERLRVSGATHRYPKGHVPANKGTRRPGWHRGRMKETQFKKGQQNHNVMPVGSTRLCDGYLYRKVSDVRYVPYTVNWKLVHHEVWEQANGPVPPKHAVIFKDGNRQNVALENLELITRRELRIRNSIHRIYPKELKSTIFAAGVLKRRIREASSGKKQIDRPA